IGAGQIIGTPSNYLLTATSLPRYHRRKHAGSWVAAGSKVAIRPSVQSRRHRFELGAVQHPPLDVGVLHLVLLGRSSQRELFAQAPDVRGSCPAAHAFEDLADVDT